MVLLDPRRNKGTKYKLSKKTCFCRVAGTVSGLEQTRFQTGFFKVAGPLYCVKKPIIPFTFYVIPVEMVCFQYTVYNILFP